MSLLAGTHYDPGTAVAKVTDTLQAMTALDTTNLRLTFTAPSNGAVMVRMRCPISGQSTQTPQILLGVLDGATVRGRQAPIMGGRVGSGANAQAVNECSFLVTGLTPGTSYTWDAAWGVEFVAASSAIRYGGPNDTTVNNAWGGFQYEIWDTRDLLAGTMYDPGTAATKSVASNAVMAVFDTTNLRLTFTCPTGGTVYVRLRCCGHLSTGQGSVLLGVLDGATVRGRASSARGAMNQISTVATDHNIYAAGFLVTGLTAGTSYTWDAAWGVEAAAASGVIAWGGPDNNTQDDAFGGFGYEIWNPTAMTSLVGQVI